MKSRDIIYPQMAQIALRDFADIVIGTSMVEGKLRIFFKDESFMDIWYSVKKEGAYAYHWERSNIDGTIYRHNNLPDKEAKKLTTYPKHFHNKSQHNITESYLQDDPCEALKTFLNFTREIIKS